MKQIKFAYILMGKGFDPQVNRVALCNEWNNCAVVGVDNMELAVSAAKQLRDEGVDVIELCGAFDDSMTREIIDALDGKIPVGHCTHFPSEDEKFSAVFGS